MRMLDDVRCYMSKTAVSMTRIKADRGAVAQVSYGTDTDTVIHRAK